ncbi:MAG TPA: cupin domain-containing protein [candidate division Zixibacteria bacterium]|jgi:mannose-6-phosphate isomerase-like protein (cupin superfamily)|nr:cupin domain-containing protein [candidate division Zixibacteria bacterium]
MDKQHWQECPLSLTHGNIIQRTMFTRETAKDSEKIGRVLRYIESFSHGHLEAGVSSTPHSSEGIQEIFFVADGAGKLVTGGQEHPLREGDGILIPPGIEYTLVNDGDIDLELLMVVESIPEDAIPANTTPLIRNYREGQLLISHWSYLVHPIFSGKDGLVQLRDILVVRIDSLQTGDNHGHGPNMDEVWYMWQGQGVHVVGQEVCVQTPGTTVSVCPSSPGHTLINHTDEPIYLFYFCSQDNNTPV